MGPLSDRRPLTERVSPLALPPPASQRLVLSQLSGCPQDALLAHLRDFRALPWEHCTAIHWHPLLNRLDALLAAFPDADRREAEGAPDGALVREVLRVLHDVIFQYPELRQAFASADRLRELLGCADAAVVLGALRCLSVLPPARQLRGAQAAAAERLLEALAHGAGWQSGLSLREACLPDCPVQDFTFEVPRTSDGAGGGAAALTLRAEDARRGAGQLLEELTAGHGVPEAYRSALRLQLCLWCHAGSAEGRREVVAISLYAFCVAVRQQGAGFLHQHLQRRPGLLAELCELLQSLQDVGQEPAVAALRAIGAILDSPRYSQNRAEQTQLSHMLGLSVPHGIAACALRGLLGEEPSASEGRYGVLLAALDVFQITTSSNHQATVQLGNAGMILAMLDLMQRKEVESVPAVAAMLRCLELAAEVSGATALILFREFSGLNAFAARLEEEVDRLASLEVGGDVEDIEPPGESASAEERGRYWRLLEEVTARRRLCRQLLKNIQVALTSAEVVQAGLANVFQGVLLTVLKKTLQDPHKVGLGLFGIAVDIVSNLIQDDPCRVPQMIDSGVLPGIVGVLSKETMRSVECLSNVPSLLAAISLHAVGEEFILKAESKPMKLVVDILVDPTFAPLLHSQPELSQVMSTHMDKVLRNRPLGSTKLPEHLVDCLMEAMRSALEEGRGYPPWRPTREEDGTGFFADRLAAFGRFCWAVLGTSDQTRELFLRKNGLGALRDLHELPCLPYFLCSLEGQQHPLGSLFNLQAPAVGGSAAALAVLQDMLRSHHQDAVAFMREHLQSAGDPYEKLAKLAEGDELGAFLRALSGITMAWEGLLGVCREAAVAQVVDTLREPLSLLAEVAPGLCVLAAWRAKASQLNVGTYAELVRDVFLEGGGAGGRRW